MTQQELADAVGTSGSVISELEAGKTKLSPKWLRRLSPVLHTTPGFLLDFHPDELPTDILDVWSSIPDERKDQALEVLKTFTRAA